MFVKHPKPPIPAGWQALPVASAAAASLTVPTGARYAVMQAITAPLRYRDDGTSPSSTVGFSLAVGSEIELTSRKQLVDFRAIAQQATTGGLEILYYKLSS